MRLSCHSSQRHALNAHLGAGRKCGLPETDRFLAYLADEAVRGRLGFHVVADGSGGLRHRLSTYAVVVRCCREPGCPFTESPAGTSSARFEAACGGLWIGRLRFGPTKHGATWLWRSVGSEELRAMARGVRGVRRNRRLVDGEVSPFQEDSAD
jgi:hypothetical protein